jgi:hypothetical protein
MWQAYPKHLDQSSSPTFITAVSNTKCTSYSLKEALFLANYILARLHISSGYSDKVEVSNHRPLLLTQFRQRNTCHIGFPQPSVFPLILNLSFQHCIHNHEVLTNAQYHPFAIIVSEYVLAPSYVSHVIECD